MNLLAARFHDEPALFDDSKKSLMETYLSKAAEGFNGKSFDDVIQFGMLSASNDDGFWGEPDSFLSYVRPYVVVDGVLQIPVKGVLLNEFPYNFGSYATGYQYIYRCYDRGLRDGNVKGIAFMINSPGGEVAGNFQLVNKLYSLRGQKPVRAFAHEYAYSAAYSIASVADEIWVSETGGVGSIGVVTSHVSYEEAYKKMGIEVTYIFAGDHKVDGNPYKALPEAVKARIQERIDALYNVFVSTVARNRGMDEKAVRDTKALTFMASEAVENGLADKIGTVEDATTAFVEFLANTGDDEMATRTPAEEKAYNEGVTYGETQARTAAETATANATATATTAAAKTERERVTGILGLDTAKARPSAVKFLIKAGASVEDAKEHLESVPEEVTASTPVVKDGEKKDEKEKPAGASAFEQHMNQDQHPNAGSSTGGNKEDTSPGALGRAAMRDRYGDKPAA